MAYRPPVSPYAAGLGCKCPRCGEGGLYKSFLGLAERCEACGLDYAKADSGDGPAVFVIFVIGFLAVVLAFVARFVWQAPTGVALLASLGLAAFGGALLIRPLKATLIALQFANKAEEGRPRDS